jgi:hypothetical protein
MLGSELRECRLSLSPSVLAGWRLLHNYHTVKVGVTSVYRQSILPCAKPLEDHDQSIFFFFFFLQLNSICHGPYVTSSLNTIYFCGVHVTRIYRDIDNYILSTIYKSCVSTGLGKQILLILCYNDSLAT